MSLYNVVFTALTPLVMGTMDSDVNRETSRKYPGLSCLSPCTSVATVLSAMLCRSHTLRLLIQRLLEVTG